MTFWVTLDKAVKYRGATRQSFSVDGETEDQARANAMRELRAYGLEGFEIKTMQPLPYPAEPRLGYKGGDCPSFCMQPIKCAGQTCCPRPISCVD